MLDVLEHLDDGMQMVIEVDHSSGHAKQREDGLHVSNMNVKYGEKQKKLRDTVMTKECLGPEEAKVYFANGKWSTTSSEGAVVIDLKLKVGEKQTSTFAAGAPPPFYDWEAQRKDTKVAPKATRKKKAGTGTGGGAGVSQTGEGDNAAGGATTEPKDKIKEGFEGKAKGQKQYLWERGWWKDGMSAAAGVAEEKNIDKVLQALPDFKTERTALQHVVESPGHILLLSPKRHPEVAGVGIGYSWGFSKQKFRRVHNDEVPKNLPANIEATMCTKNYLTIGRVRRFARRTREYCRAYSNLLLDGVIVKSKELIEKMRAKQKAHRNILDMEPGFLNKQ